MTLETTKPAEPAAEATPPIHAAPHPELEKRWLVWPGTALERLPWPYGITVIVLSVAALLEQLLEYSLEPALKTSSAFSPFRLAVFPALVMYIMGSLYILKRVAVKSLAGLRTSVKIDDQDYEQHVRRLIMANPRLELILLLVSIAVVLLFFVVLDLDLLNTNQGLPASLPQAIFIVCMYVLLGWLLLTIVYTILRQTRALNALAHRPLVINEYDLSNLEPFGSLGLVQSLPIVGIALVPLIILGTPTKGGYLVIFLSAISFLALFFPLWGVHEQIGKSHERSLLAIHQELQEIQAALLHGNITNPPEVGALSNRTSALLGLRKTIQETPSWPFKDTATVVRAAFAVTSPLIYFILTELIRTYLLPMF
jgi:hypothetical protein